MTTVKSFHIVDPAIYQEEPLPTRQSLDGPAMIFFGSLLYISFLYWRLDWFLAPTPAGHMACDCAFRAYLILFPIGGGVLEVWEASARHGLHRYIRLAFGLAAIAAALAYGWLTI